MFSQTKFLTALYMATGGAVVYGTAVFLFSSTHSGMEYVLELENSTQDWLTSEFYGLWHLAEFVGVLASIFFLVSLYNNYYEGHAIMNFFLSADSVHDDVASV